MGELAERVEDGELGIGRREEGEGKGNGTTDDWVSIVKLGWGECCVYMCVHLERWGDFNIHIHVVSTYGFELIWQLHTCKFINHDSFARDSR